MAARAVNPRAVLERIKRKVEKHGLRVYRAAPNDRTFMLVPAETPPPGAVSDGVLLSGLRLDVLARQLQVIRPWETVPEFTTEDMKEVRRK